MCAQNQGAPPHPIAPTVVSQLPSPCAAARGLARKSIARSAMLAAPAKRNAVRSFSINPRGAAGTRNLRCSSHRRFAGPRCALGRRGEIFSSCGGVWSLQRSIASWVARQSSLRLRVRARAAQIKSAASSQKEEHGSRRRRARTVSLPQGNRRLPHGRAAQSGAHIAWAQKQRPSPGRARDMLLGGVALLDTTARNGVRFHWTPITESARHHLQKGSDTKTKPHRLRYGYTR